MPSAIPRILVIVGPTASGKTALAIELAKKYDGEIVSADSRQIYRDMNIGTAKALRDNQKSKKYVSEGILHHLVDIKNPDEDYSAADFKRDAIHAINDILKRGKLPILVGGTGLYIKVVIDNLTIPEVKADPTLRKKLESEIEKEGLPSVFKKLITLDPEAAYIIDPKNPRRVIRALEIALKTKMPFSASRKSGPPLYDTIQIGLFPGNEVLEKRIRERTKTMFKSGLIDEVKTLLKKYSPRSAKSFGETSPQCKAFDAIGYREIIDYLDGKISLAEAEELINKNSVRYAKRQMTWFKNDKRIQWVEKPEDAIGSKIIKF